MFWIADPIGPVKYSDIVDKTILYDKYVILYPDEFSIRNRDTHMLKASNNTDDYSENSFNVYKINNNMISVEETSLSLIEDDYGDSYYYRGTVIDNYLEFNGMCFRIVRIEGDGSVKLTLAAEKSCSLIDDQTDTTTAFIKDSNGELITSIYGYKNDVVYGAMADYENYEGGVKDNLEEWFNNSFMNGTELNEFGLKLKEDMWHIGGDFNYRYGYNDYLPLSNLDTTTTWRYLDSLAIKTFTIYDLKYENEEKNIKSYFGMLITDEVNLAGATFSSNNNYYLYTNANDSYFLLNVGMHLGKSDYIGMVRDGATVYYSVTNRLVGAKIRPSITLLNTTLYVSGNGTKTNPYIVE